MGHEREIEGDGDAEFGLLSPGFECWHGAHPFTLYKLPFVSINGGLLMTRKTFPCLAAGFFIRSDQVVRL